MDDITVLVCDDSALMRNLISKIVNANSGMKVVGTAMNGQFALNKIPRLKPDILILDIEMPTMTGLEFLRERKARHWDLPVIILSSIATKGAAVTMECLEYGASDFITKPGGSISHDLTSISSRLIELVASYGGTYARRQNKNPYPVDFFVHQMKMRQAEDFVAKKTGEHISLSTDKKTELHPLLWTRKDEKPKKIEPVVSVREGGKIELIALGISTGGPNALRIVFKMIDPHLKQPILVVQHMPAGFTTEFANSLNKICPLTVTEAVDGEKIENGHIYIAPGNYHIFVEHRSTGNVIRLSQSALRNGHRPSADVLFESVAKVYKNNAMGVIMTGMGKDGASELASMRKEGAWTLGQDESSCIVYGMPKVAWEYGAVQKQVPLNDMADAISSLAREHL